MACQSEDSSLILERLPQRQQCRSPAENAPKFLRATAGHQTSGSASIATEKTETPNQCRVFSPKQLAGPSPRALWR